MLERDDYVTMPSGLIIPEDAARREIERMTPPPRPKGMDFFCGAGGFSLGAIQGGIEVLAAVENDPLCVMTYMSNLCRYGQVTMHFVEPHDKERMNAAVEREFKRTDRMPVAGSGWISGQPASTPSVSHMFIGDAKKLTSARVLSDLGMKRGDLDCIFGGPPCQGYSISGKRDVMDPRSSLLFEFARFIVELNPKTMVMENVPGILSMVTPDGVPVVDKFLRIIEDGGFGGYEAFRRTIEAQTGSFGLLRSRKVAKGRKAIDESDDTEADEAPPQGDLFA